MHKPSGDVPSQSPPEVSSASADASSSLLTEIKDFAGLCHYLNSLAAGEARYQGFIKLTEDWVQSPDFRTLITFNASLLQFINLFAEPHRFACLAIIKTRVLEMLGSSPQPMKIQFIISIMALLPLNEQIECSIWFVEYMPQVYKSMINDSLASLVVFLKAHPTEAERQYFLTLFEPTYLVGLLAEGSAEEVSDVLAALPPDNVLHNIGLNFDECMKHLARFKIRKELRIPSLLTILKGLSVEKRPRFISAVEQTGDTMIGIIHRTTWITQGLQPRERALLSSREDESFGLPARAASLRPDRDAKSQQRPAATSSPAFMTEVKRDKQPGLPEDAVNLSQIRGEAVRAFEAIVYRPDILLALIDRLRSPSKKLSHLIFDWLVGCLSIAHLQKMIAKADLFYAMLDRIDEEVGSHLIELLGKDYVLSICGSADQPLTSLQRIPTELIRGLFANMQELTKTLVKVTSLNEVDEFIAFLYQYDILKGIVFNLDKDYKTALKQALAAIEPYQASHPLHYQLLLSTIAYAYRDQRAAIRLQSLGASSSQSLSSLGPDRDPETQAAEDLARLLGDNVKLQIAFTTEVKQKFQLPKVLEAKHQPILQPQGAHQQQGLLPRIFKCVLPLFTLSEADLRKRMEGLTSKEQRRCVLPIIWLFMLDASCQLEVYTSFEGVRFDGARSGAVRPEGARLRERRLQVGEILFKFMQDDKKKDNELQTELQRQKLDDVLTPGKDAEKDKLGMIYAKCMALSK